MVNIQHKAISQFVRETVVETLDLDSQANQLASSLVEAIEEMERSKRFFVWEIGEGVTILLKLASFPSRLPWVDIAHLPLARMQTPAAGGMIGQDPLGLGQW